MDRVESRPMESLLRFIIKPIQYLSPTLMTTPTVTLAKSMIANTIFKTQTEKVEIIFNNKIFELAKLYGDGPNQ